MNNKKVIVCDLDGTLAQSKSEISTEMAEVLGKILSKHFLAIVSGGAFPQFQKQFLSKLSCPGELLKNLYLFPTMGSTCYVYDEIKSDWKKLYEEKLTEEERKEIITAFNEAILSANLDLSGSYGEILEDRGTQITFSGKGQNAPISIKKDWDPDQKIRRGLISILQNKIPKFELRIGGATSIDVTKKGIDKAYAVEKIKELLNVDDSDIIFVGDALYKGGNDSAIKKTNVDYIQESGPNETIELLSTYL